MLSCKLDYAIRSFEQDGFRKCSRVPIKPIARLRLSFFIQRYDKDSVEVLNHIVRVTGDEIWVLFVNVDTKDQSKRYMHTYSSDKPKTLE
jgi:hypothetical protein